MDCLENSWFSRQCHWYSGQSQHNRWWKIRDLGTRIWWSGFFFLFIGWSRWVCSGKVWPIALASGAWVERRQAFVSGYERQALCVYSISIISIAAKYLAWRGGRKGAVCFWCLIPTALSIDRFNILSFGNSCDCVCVVGEKVPGIATVVDDFVICLPCRDRQFVFAQIFPDIFHRVEFWCVSGQRQ